MSKFRFDNKDHAYYLDDREIPGVTRINDLSGIDDPIDGSTRRKDFYTEEGRSRGKDAHDSICYFIRGEFPDDDSNPWIKSYKSFCSSTRFVADPSMSEVSTWHEFPYFGMTFDAIGKIDNDLVLLDFKTGAAKISDKIQISAYRFGIEQRYQELKINQALLLYLHPERGVGYTTETIEPCNQIIYYEIFKAAYAIQEFKCRGNWGKLRDTR